MINPERVNLLFMDCLFRDGEDTSKHVAAQGIQGSIGFHPERLESHRAEVEGMLSHLPSEFKKTGGGGWSFLNACNDTEGNQWTDMHQRMDSLFMLGIALGKAQWQLPREMLVAMPGGMPYVSIDVP